VRSSDSGRRRGAKKGRVEAYPALKVSDLPRERISAGATEFTMTHERGEGADKQSVMERVGLHRVAAGFGGTRTYLLCPGSGCGRRVMALYLVNDLFRCRHCHGLTYESQREDARRRAGRSADKARARLEYKSWQPFGLAPMVRPKGMWTHTFWERQGRVLAADYAATEAFMARLRSLTACRGRVARTHKATAKC
jgi:hypothetical protein